MTDNEIIKGLKCLSGDEIFCKDCAFSHLEGHGFACKKNVANAVLDLINRQRAEIERLVKGFEEAKKGIEEAKVLVVKDIVKAKAEAIKQFADKLQEYLADHNAVSASYLSEFVKKLAKELTEGSC